MCTGRIDPGMVARAFKKGLDGLMVVGCYFGDCHYISGNYQAKAKIEITQKLLDYIGVNKDRLAFRQCSSGEASVFVKLVSEFDAKIKELGPIGQGGDRLDAPEIFEKLKLAEAVLDGEKIRWVIGKRTPFLESGNIYGEIFTEHEFNRAVDMIIVEETEVQAILNQLKDGARSVRNLAEDLAIPSERVFRYVTALLRKEMIRLENVAERTPLYRIA
jgi:F420-non-reducing hydrogenase iron-sulfur subunit